MVVVIVVFVVVVLWYFGGGGCGDYGIGLCGVYVGVVVVMELGFVVVAAVVTL